MKALYLDCSMGIAGDMALAALIDAGADKDRVIAAIDSLGLDGVRLTIERTAKNGFACRRVRVEHPPQHEHRGLSDCLAIASKGNLTKPAFAIVERLFRAIAVAEAKVHGCGVEEVHFHEVGAIDSIVDIIAVAVAFDSLKVDTVIASPIPVGRGHVRIAHGVCPLPAPATAELLIGVPLAVSPVEGELTTPTGAAIVRELVDRFEPLPALTMETIGYGAGTRSYPNHPNMLRAIRGTIVAASNSDTVELLETNLDDVTGEVIGYARERLFAAGALDVFTQAIHMKKDRPGVCLSVLCRPSDRAACETIIFNETGTLGIRRVVMERSIRARHPSVVETPFGPVAGKKSIRPDGRTDFTPEFESCRTIATGCGHSLRDVYRAALFAAKETLPDGAVAEKPNQPEVDSHSHDHAHDHSHDGGHSHSHDH